MRSLLFLFLAGIVSGTEIPEKEIEKKIGELRKSGVLTDKTIKEIERYIEEGKGIHKRIKEKALEEWRIRQKKDGSIEIVRKTEEKKKIKNKVYIFMSSSVPEEVWNIYMNYVLDKNIPAVFLLRGCIGGCKYIRPTLEFIQRVLKERPLEVWIDPVKFKNYRVKVVPCVAVEGKEKLSCGDWNLEYHMRELGVW